MADPRADVLANPASRMDFESFYGTEHLRLFRALLLATGDRAEAEDVAHDAFVRLYERWDRVANMESPSAYLYVTAWNAYRNGLRRAARRAKRLIVERDEAEDHSSGVVLRSDLFRALSALSSKEREAIALIDYLGLTSQEAGDATGARPDAIRARVHRARERLRKELDTGG